MKIEILETKVKRLNEAAGNVWLEIMAAAPGPARVAMEDALELLSDELETASDELADAMNEAGAGSGHFVSF